MRKPTFSCILLALTALAVPFWASAATLPVPSLEGFINSDKSPKSLYYSGAIEGIKQTPYKYLFPNEPYPQDAQPILQHSTPGVYISVGTERGFLGAAMSKATHLLLLDRELQVVLYNRLNIIFLKIANGNIERFRSLRKNRILHLSEVEESRLTETERNLVKTVVPSIWWKSVISHLEHSKDSPFARFTLNQTGDHPFAGVHYWHYEEPFQKLTEMAINNHIQAEQIELSDEQAVENLVQQLRANHLKVSVVDLSNAWHQDYLGPERTRALFNQFRSVIRDESLFLITKTGERIRRPDGSDPQVNWRRWAYFAASALHFDLSNFWDSQLENNEQGEVQFFNHFKIDRNYVPACAQILTNSLFRSR